MSIQALREKRGKIAAALKDLTAKVDWDEITDKATYDNAMDEIEKIDASIKRVNDANERIADEDRTEALAGRAEQRGRDGGSAGLGVYAKWLRGGDRAMNAADWQSIQNVMSTTTTTEGGFTVQTDVATSLLDALKAYGAMRGVATILRTSAGNPMSFPTSDGTTETGEWIAENVTATSLDPSFNTKSLPVWKAGSKIAAVPFELLQDSSIDVEAFVQGRLAIRLGRLTNTGYTVGTGTAQPTGIMVAATNGVTATAATSQVTAITYGSLVDLIHSVDPAYRALGNCRFMMNDASVKVIRKIVDTQNRPIFVPGYDTLIPGASGAAPDVLLGYPITINQDVAVMAASAKSILFGDLSFYTIRDSMEISMFRFADSPYIKLGQIGFLAWMRTGGNLIDVGGAVKTFINAAT